MEDRLNLTNLELKLADFEVYRKKVLRRHKVYTFIRKIFRFIMIPAFIVGMVGVVFTVLLAVLWPFLVIAIGLFIIDLLLYYYVFKTPDVEFKNRFKTEILKPAIEEYNPTFEYSYNKMVSTKQVNQSMLFSLPIKKQYGEDHVKGQVNGVDVEFSEIVLKTYEETHKRILKGIADVVLDNDGGPRLRTFFYGMIFIVDFHKEFKGVHIAVSKKKPLTNTFLKSTHYGLQKEKMEHLNFVKNFDFYCNDKRTSFYILTPYLMENLVKLNSGQKSAFVSFKDDKMFLAIDFNKDLFECDIYKGIPDIESFKMLYNEINLIEKVVKDLKQDVRLWSKE